METERLTYEKPDKYRKEVLIGNWPERRCSYIKNPHNFRTTYMNHYPPKPFSANNPAFLWDQKLRSQGYGPRIIFDHQAPNYLENMSTTYDLCYNHIAKLSDGPVPRTYRVKFKRYEPEQDYARNYGNATKFGLINYYKEKWRCEEQDPRTTLTTHYQDTFLPPRKEDLLFRRWAIPLPNSTIMDTSNRIMHGLQLREKQLTMVPEEKPVLYKPYESKCNPITWECKDALKEVPNRCIAMNQRI